MEHTDKNIPTIEASPNNNKTISKHTENKKQIMWQTRNISETITKASHRYNSSWHG
jgi:hypothetical protein